MNYMLDGIVLLVFALSVFIGYRRGFIKTIAGVAAFVVALVVASSFAAPVSVWVYDTTVEPSVTAALEEQMISAGAGATAQIDTAYETLPALVKNLLAQAGVADADGLAQVLPSVDGAAVAEQVAAVVRSVVLPLLEAVCSLALFLVTNIVVSLVLRVLNVVAKLPLLKQLNKTLGLVGGVISGALWVLFTVTMIQIIAALGTPDSAITLATVEDTLLVGSLAEINPLAGTLLELIK